MSEPLVPVPRRVRAWQPESALLLVSQARAFAAAHWDDVRQHGAQTSALTASALTDDVLEADDGLHSEHALSEARAFTDDGLARASDGFQPLKIRPFNEPLSALSRQALQRFNAEQAAANPIVDESWSHDAHAVDEHAQAVRPYRAEPLLQRAAFVPDVYEFDDEPQAWTDDEAHEAVAQTALDDEAHPEGMVLDAATDEQTDARTDTQSSPEQTLAEEALTEEAFTEEAITADAQTASDSEPALAGEDDAALQADESGLATAHAEEAVAEEADAQDTRAQEEHAEETQAEETESTPDADAQRASADASDTTAALASESDATEAALSESDLAQADGMAPQEWVQAEQEAVEAAFDAAWQEAQPPAPPGIDLEEVARREAEQYQLGYAEGERVAREALAQEIAAQRTVLEGVTRELHALLQQPKQFFEPLKRLAVHVAEQVVLSELALSSKTIERLIARCLDSLDHPAQGMVVVELHPQDKARLLDTAPDLIRGMRIDAVDTLHPGSVRVFANDTIVEDLVEHRLHALVRGLSLDESAWAARSGLLHEPALHEPATPAPSELQPDTSSESDDVHP